MRRSWWLGRIIAAALGLALLLAGCSVALRISYNQGPTLMYWWMDGYADFNDQQSPRARQLVEQWFHWNRNQALPDYARLLEQAQTQVLDPVLTPQAMCRMAGAVRERVLQAYDQGVPSLAELALTLDESQLAHMAKRFAKNNAKFRDEFLPAKPEARIKAQVKKVEERVEMVYGSIDDAQHERIVQLVAGSPYDPELWLAERRTMQQEVLQALRALQQARGAGATPAQLNAQAQFALRELGRHFEHSPRAAYAAQQQRVWDYNCAMTSQIHNALTPAQHQHAREKIGRWRSDVLSLYAER